MNSRIGVNPVRVGLKLKKEEQNSYLRDTVIRHGRHLPAPAPAPAPGITSFWRAVVMEHGGNRPGAGRRKGAHNKASAQREKLISQSGATPIDVMIGVMRYHFNIAEHELLRKKPNKNEVKTAFARAIDAAHKAAPFVHPRLSAIDHSAKLDPSRLTEHELATVVPILRKCVVSEPSVSGSSGFVGEPPSTIKH
jgi:hypothetical protein